MTIDPPSIHDVSRRVIAFEAARDPSDGPGGAAARTRERLKTTIEKFAGVAGFRSLLSRAVALAKPGAPKADPDRVGPGGPQEGFAADDHNGSEEAEVVAQLLGLLVAFIGEALTLRLVADAWPDLLSGGTGRGAEG